MIPNGQETKKFLSVIAPDGAITFQTFDDKKDGGNPRLIKILHGGIEENNETLARINQAGAGIFFMVNCGDGKGRRTDNVTSVRGIFVDLDENGINKLEKIKQMKSGTPRLVVESSPGRFHVYWLIDGVLPLDHFTPVQKHFANLFGGDPAICDLPRVMRLPGYFHNKGTPFKSRIVLDNPNAPPLPVKVLKRIMTNSPKTRPSSATTAGHSQNAEFEIESAQGLPTWLPEALNFIDSQPYDKWLKVGMALHHSTKGHNEGLQLYLNWSGRAKNFDPHSCRNKWSSFGKTEGEPLTLGTIFHFAQEAGWPGFPKEEKKQDDLPAIQHLASLSTLDYERERKDAANKLGIRTAVLDKMVRDVKEQEELHTGLVFDDVEPWDASVNGGTLLTDIVDTVQRFIVCKSETAQAVALWVAMTWLMDVVQVAPLAIITAPEKRCGKSQLLFLLGRLVYRPLTASNISTAALFRTIDAWRPTMLVDEADSFMKENEDMRGLLNSGHTRDGAYIIRVVGDDHDPKRFNTWGAKALAGIGKLSDTLMDRAIILELRRKLPHEKVDRLRYAEPDLFQIFSRKLCRFSMDFREQVRQARPQIPETLNDRAQDNWEPLLAIADVAGGQWPKLARQTAVKLSSESDPVLTIGLELLADIREIFELKKVTRINSSDLIISLCQDEEKPWATYNRGNPIKPRQVSRRLSEYGIMSNTIRIGQSTAKGYKLEQFTETFSRYLDSSPCQCVTPSQPPISGPSDVAECSL